MRQFAELMYNRVLTHVPDNALRVAALRRLGASLGDHVYLFGSSEVLAPQFLRIAGRCHIGRSCQIDARGGIDMGWDVVIASHVLMITADHDTEDPTFAGRLGRIAIGDRAWIGSRAVILKGVTIGEGAVVGAGSVVHRDVEPWTVVSGVPARRVRDRSRDQTYRIDYGPRWY